MNLAIFTEDGKKEPGNFGDPVGLGMHDADMRAKEINNGRFAMFSAIGRVGVPRLMPRHADARTPQQKMLLQNTRGMPRLMPRRAMAYG